MRHRSPGRFLAPLALLAAILAVALVVSAATGGDEEDGARSSGTSTSASGKTTTSRETSSQDGASRTSTTGSKRKTYTVEPGDTLGSIAEQAGVPITELQDLNPDVDPQSLTVGQRLRLRR